MKKLITGLIALLATTIVNSQDLTDWDSVLKQARGQTVHFNSWGGSHEVNNYIRWTNQRLKALYGITLQHVKVSDIAKTTQHLQLEKNSGKNQNGSVDLVWVNGENFLAMKRGNLLYGPFVDKLPNWKFVDKSLPVTEDFTEPTEGLEAPWGVGQFVFIHDSATLNTPPKSFIELLKLAKDFPGKITYPQPPNYFGSSFLKAALLELTPHKEELYKPINIQTEKTRFNKVINPLWSYLDELHPVCWRKGKLFPSSSNEMLQLLDDRQLLLAITFNPNETSTAIENGKLPNTARTFAFEQGALSNIHFLAIPWNAKAKAGALVTINFLMSPEAQARKANIHIWGDTSILNKEVLNTQGQSGNSNTLFKPIPEPHPSWLIPLETEWLKRYGH